MLEIDGLTVRFDGIEALRDLTLAVPTGTRIGVLGPNGSGKTTLFNAISGLVGRTAGTIRLDGQAISSLAPHHIAAAGVARTFQAVRLFQRLSALDNVLPARGPAAATARKARQNALAALDAVGLGAQRDTLAGDLTFFEQRRLEIARAIAQQPRLLLADEPTGGLSQAESDHVVDLLAHAFGAETTILLIEHKITIVEALCPRSLLLAEGRLISDAATREMLRDHRLASVYFGSRLAP
ncbi:MAG: ABC transporter ATP-binding protein [Hyphomicrobiaceae bacterium]